MVTTPSPIESLPTDLRTVEGFEQWQRRYAREGSYEFVRGCIIEKRETKQPEAFILKFLSRAFINTAAFQQGNELFA